MTKNRKVTLIEIFSTKRNFLLKAFLILYIISFIGASYNHSMDLIKYGLFPYQRINQNVSLALNIYWTLLTVFDPLAIVLLYINIDLGLMLFGLIIISDVVINYSYIISNSGWLGWLNFGQLCQLGFLIFYLCTFLYIHKQTQMLGSNT